MQNRVNYFLYRVLSKCICKEQGGGGGGYKCSYVNVVYAVVHWEV